MAATAGVPLSPVASGVGEVEPAVAELVAAAEMVATATSPAAVTAAAEAPTSAVLAVAADRSSLLPASTAAVTAARLCCTGKLYLNAGPSRLDRTTRRCLWAIGSSSACAAGASALVKTPVGALAAAGGATPEAALADTTLPATAPLSSKATAAVAAPRAAATCASSAAAMATTVNGPSPLPKGAGGAGSSGSWSARTLCTARSPLGRITVPAMTGGIGAPDGAKAENGRGRACIGSRHGCGRVGCTGSAKATAGVSSERWRS